MTGTDYDVIFVGGGLSATLAAYRLHQLQPGLRLCVIESGPTLGGNHTWSFHDNDISRAAKEWTAPFLAQSWPRQAVRFPKYTRMLPIPYHTISSHKLHEAALAALGDAVRFGVRASDISAREVRLEGGDAVTAACVIDARGQRSMPGLTIGYQKFVGIEVGLRRPHGQPDPIIMDATVKQQDGYRFVYTLPFTEDRILIEDTYYSDTSHLDVERLTQECLRYAERAEWDVDGILRVETGVLPIVLSGKADTSNASAGVPALGLRAGFFHHTTSYSFPFAVRMADEIAAMPNLTSETLMARLAALQQVHWKEQRFFRLLNRMLFWAAEPEKRYRVLERFYSLGEPMIERFYSSSLTLADQARILAGWPPVPITRALRVLNETAENPLAAPKPAVAP
jgi:lycopene beta-cyclase